MPTTITAGGRLAAEQVDSYPTLTVQLTGTWTGTIQFEVSNDNAAWVTIRCTPPGTTTAVTATTANGIWVCSPNGTKYFTLNATAWTSGTATVTAVFLGAGGGASGGGAGACPLTNDASDTSDNTNDACRVTVVTAIQPTNIVPKTALALTSIAWTNGGSSGNLSLVAGSANQKISVFGFDIYCNGANNWFFQSGTTNSPPTIWHTHNFAAGQGADKILRADPYFETRNTATATDNDLIINFSAAQTCVGLLDYTKG